MKASQARIITNKNKKFNLRKTILRQIRHNAEQGLNVLYVSNYLTDSDITYFEKLGYKFSGELAVDTLRW